MNESVTFLNQHAEGQALLSRVKSIRRTAADMMRRQSVVGPEGAKSPGMRMASPAIAGADV